MGRKNEETFFKKDKRGRGRAKHGILSRNLNGWLPALGMAFWAAPLVYIDGFAGPGYYDSEEGFREPGSPILAYRATAGHKYLPRCKSEVWLIFVEKDASSALQLELNLEKEAREWENTPHVKEKGKTNLITCIILYLYNIMDEW